MLVILRKSYDDVSYEAARLVADRLRRKPNLVLGLATGGTPLGLYRALIDLHKKEGLDFSKVTTFNLDEYIGLPPSHEQSYRHFMNQSLFKHLNLDPRYTHVPDGMAPDIEAHCKWYEQRIRDVGGIDLQILGIGVNGHIAFNEPGSSLGSRTRIKTLSERTVRDNARFFSTLDDVPKYAITMGIGTIMEARELLILASGEQKAEAVKRAVEGPITATCPASICQMHQRAFFIIDEDARSKLTEVPIEEVTGRLYAHPEPPGKKRRDRATER
ncbi:MAG TPA: glucosamine-6-phosphate deaminase [Gemmatimonadaceae bacterium]|nr:glucosamine-6-phosphate deaminase [Gemmatimonadaceae bacterium]